MFLKLFRSGCKINSAHFLSYRDKSQIAAPSPKIVLMSKNEHYFDILFDFLFSIRKWGVLDNWRLLTYRRLAERNRCRSFSSFIWYLFMIFLFFIFIFFFFLSFFLFLFVFLFLLRSDARSYLEEMNTIYSKKSHFLTF